MFQGWKPGENLSSIRIKLPVRRNPYSTTANGEGGGAGDGWRQTTTKIIYFKKAGKDGCINTVMVLIKYPYSKLVENACMYILKKNGEIEKINS